MRSTSIRAKDAAMKDDEKKTIVLPTWILWVATGAVLVAVLVVAWIGIESS